MRLSFCFAVFAAASLAQDSRNVLVVVNQNSVDSQSVAQYYIQRRKIPAANLCRINTTTAEEIQRQIYDQAIAPAVGRCIASLKEPVIYIVTTLGVPLKIAGSGGRDGDQAAVDSELAAMRIMQSAKRRLTGWIANPFFSIDREEFNQQRFPLYMVTRLTAYDVAGVKAMIDRGMNAKNAGSYIVDLAADVAEDGNEWLTDAAIYLPAGRVVVEQTPAVVRGARNVLGYAAWGSNDPARRDRRLGFQWVPGAIATEFVSTNARTFQRPPASWRLSSWKPRDRPLWFAGSPQSLTADLIDEGASAATGHVYEPYLQNTPRPQILLTAYASGRNLAESFYLSIPALSWQNIVVGDPLLRLPIPRAVLRLPK